MCEIRYRIRVEFILDPNVLIRLLKPRQLQCDPAGFRASHPIWEELLDDLVSHD